MSYLTAVPLAYFAMRGWLQHYHLPDYLIFVDIFGGEAGALLITIAVVSSQAVRAAVANPVKRLRSE